MMHKEKKVIVYIAGLIVLCSLPYLFTGCAVKKGRVYEKDGELYGKTDGLFKSRWYNYYLRGCSYTEGGYWEDAAADYLVAIGRRSNDQRRARTYGMHVIDYFPRRELGIAWYNLGKYQQAIQALETSLASVETARAKYYLNLARKAWLERAGLDTKPPSVAVTFPPPQYSTNDFSVTVRGTARDNYFVKNVIVNNAASTLELSRSEVSFAEEFVLQQGKNLITIRSEDILGKTSTAVELKVFVDRQGPLVMLACAPDSAGVVSISGRVYDESGIADLTINGRTLAFKNTAAGSFHESFAVGPEGVHFSVRDTVGNVTTGVIPVASGRGSPVIDLAGLKDHQVSYKSSLCVQGLVAAAKGVRELDLNGQPLLAAKARNDFRAFLKKQDRSISVAVAFSKRIKLVDKNNTVRVSHVDSSGRTVEKEVMVERVVPRVRRINSRLSMAVLPFAEKKPAERALQDTVRSVLMTAFTNQKRFNVFEAGKVDEVLHKESGDVTALAAQEKAAEMGIRIGADTVLQGAITASGVSVGVDARLVDVETQRVLAEMDVYWEGDRWADVWENMDRLARKFKEHLPLREGRVEELASSYARIDLGSSDGIRPGMRFLAYSDEEPKEPAGKGVDLGSDTIIQALLSAGEVKVESARTDIEKLFTERGMVKGDNIITK